MSERERIFHEHFVVVHACDVLTETVIPTHFQYCIGYTGLREPRRARPAQIMCLEVPHLRFEPKARRVFSIFYRFRIALNRAFLFRLLGALRVFGRGFT